MVSQRLTNLRRKTMAKRNSKKSTMSTRTVGAFRAHLTRAQNALKATRSRTERAALRVKIAHLQSVVGSR
jgi:hypothetical protein